MAVRDHSGFHAMRPVLITVPGVSTRENRTTLE